MVSDIQMPKYHLLVLWKCAVLNKTLYPAAPIHQIQEDHSAKVPLACEPTSYRENILEFLKGLATPLSVTLHKPAYFLLRPEVLKKGVRSVLSKALQFVATVPQNTRRLLGGIGSQLSSYRCCLLVTFRRLLPAERGKKSLQRKGI
jgi:hypothetical protein